MKAIFWVLPVFSLGCAASVVPAPVTPVAPAPSAAPAAPAQPPLDDGADEAADRARLRPTACRDTMAAYFRRHNDGATVAAILAEAAYGGYRSEIEGGAPCIDERL